MIFCINFAYYEIHEIILEIMCLKSDIVLPSSMLQIKYGLEFLTVVLHPTHGAPLHDSTATNLFALK